MIALLRPQQDARSRWSARACRPWAAYGGPFSPSRCQIRSTPLVVDCPARLAQQRGDLAIAIVAVLPGKLDNIGGETLLRRDARRHADALSPAQCRHGDAWGLEISPGSLLQKLIQCQIRNRASLSLQSSWMSKTIGPLQWKWIIPSWRRRTNVWRRVTSPGNGAPRQERH
jgi:hypothetical protein